MKRELIALLAAASAAPALADISVSTYDDLAENFYGSSFHYNGVTYSNVNDQAGVFPDGNVIIPGDPIFGLGDQVIVENATLLYNDFPDYGSANNALTFGTTYVVGDNLSLGALSTVTMTLDQVADFASLELAYYENGPWGGIVYHLDAFRNGSLVASDSFSISDLGGRDNIAFATMSVDGAVFDTLQLYATWNGQYTGPRGLVDNLTLNTVPAPGALALLGLGGLAGRRRR
jgi:hypothetical protein